MLLHKLIVLWLPWIQYIGGVAGERHTAVDLLKEGFWSGKESPQRNEREGAYSYDLKHA